MVEVLTPETVEDDVVKRATEWVADGKTVDWGALFQLARTPEQHQQLNGLRLLEDVANLARTTGDEPEADLEASHDQSDPHAPPDGTHEMWGKYRLLEKVGEGSFGRVYRALDPQLDLEVAIKILHERVEDSRLKKQLLDEGRRLAKVKHPNVVSVFGVEFEDDQMGLCTEFVPGETLEAVVNAHGPLNPREAVLVGERVCEALTAVHAAGFVHRDVKARNVMRERSGRVVLMDFGTGREAKQLAAPGRIDMAGTPLYMAPELLVGRQPATECSDVYSVGVLLYHLVTSKYPIEAATVNDLRIAHEQRRYRSVSEHRTDLSPAFVRVVQRALAPDPHHRYATAGALLEALSRIFPKERAIRVIARRLLMAVFAGIVLGSALTALGWLSSAVFNLTLERRDFVNETLRDWLIVGVRCAILPISFLALASLGTGLCLVVRRLAIALSSIARKADADVRAYLSVIGRRLGLDDASVLASWILLLSAGSLVSVWWYFWPMVEACLTSLPNAPAELLATLSPASVPYQTHYRQVFSALGIATVAAWYGVSRLAAYRGQSLNRLLIAGGVGTLALALASSVLPYRLIHSDNEFKVVLWKGVYCYIVGERTDDLLLFCPTLSPARTRLLPRDADGLERQNQSENIFTRFSPVKASE